MNALDPDRRALTHISDTSIFNPCVSLLPNELKADARQLYRALRTIDDLVDDGNPQAEQRVEAIERWALGQVANSPEARIFTELSRRYLFTPQPLLEFCAGMRHDLNCSLIEGEQDLEGYCQRVGGAVGTLFARIVGISHPDGEDKLAILGRAFQRTHILRDIDEDYAHGRLYIARSTIERFGFPTPGAREDLLRDQITRAEQLYEEGIDAISLFPRARRAIALAVALYREILRQIERDGYGRTPGRVVVPAWRTRLLIYRHRYGPVAG